MKKDTTLQIRITTDLKNKLSSICDNMDLTYTEFIELCIKDQYIFKNKKLLDILKKI